MHPLSTSKAAIRRAVIVGSAKHPVTVGSAAVAVLSALATPLVGGLFPLLTAIGAAVLALVSWGFNLVARRMVYVGRYLADVDAGRERARLQALGKVRAMLFDLAQSGDCADLAARGLEQYQRIERRHAGFHELLAKKLSVGELAYGRFIDAVDAAYGAVIGNLIDVVDTLEIVTGIDVMQLQARVDALHAVETRGDSETRELGALNERLRLRESHVARIRGLLSRNDEAITALLGTTSAVAEMKSLDRHGAQDMERVVDELDRLADRARVLDQV